MKSSAILREHAALEEAYAEITHPSGLTVVVCPKELSTYYATLGVRFGALDALDEEKTPCGIAHFLEHKMFERADGEDTDRIFAALGAEVNAFTSYERTAYQISCTDHFPEALRELFALVASLSVTAASVRRERAIIAEEIRMSADNPYERCYAELVRALYHTHGVREEICGSERSIARITPAVLRKHYEAYYRPEHMILSVCGRVTPEEVLVVVDECLPAREGQNAPAPPPTTFHEPPTVAKPLVTLPMAVAKPLFCAGVKQPHVPEDRMALLKLDISMTLLCEMIFSRSGELYNDLFERGIISPAWSYGASVGRGYAYLAVSGEADRPEAVVAAIRAHVDRLKKDGLSAEDLERCRRILYADYVTDFDSTEDVAEAMWGYAADRLSMFDYLTVLHEVTVADMEKLLQDIFTDGHIAVSVITPMDKKGEI